MSEKNESRERPAMNFRRGPGRGGPGGMFAEPEKAENVRGTFRRLITYFKGQIPLIIGLLAIVIVGTLCGVIAPTLQSNAIDIVAGERSGSLINAVIVMFIAYAIYCVCKFFQDAMCARLSQHIVRKMRGELFGKLIDIPVKYLDQHSHGDVMSRMTNDVENISTTVSQSLPLLFSGVLTIIGTLIMMLRFCWQLTLLTCVTVILVLIMTKIFSKKMRQFSRERQRVLGILNGNVEEMVNGYHTVVAYNHQGPSIDEFNHTSDDLTKAGIRIFSLGGAFGPLMNSIGNLSFVIVAAFGAYFAINGIISVGVISAFIIYSKQFSMPINQLASIYSQLQSAIAGAERVFDVLDEEPEDMSGEDMETHEDLTVTFDHVDFSYIPGTKVLKDFSLTVPSGKKVALVGATGSGKTTVVNLLMRFYDIDSGSISINGQDITDISRGDLRRNVAIVLQDTTLFTDTIMNNLRYGNADATEEQIEEAAALSRSKHFIESLPEKWDTMLVGSGSNLSHGQRQLMAIARAFVADPGILILDEATSNVDTRTEKSIQDAMQKLMQDRTSIVIAHRLSTIQNADLIVVMDNGCIVESGTHTELLAAGGKYADLYMTQYSGNAT